MRSDLIRPPIFYVDDMGAVLGTNNPLWIVLARDNPNLHITRAHEIREWQWGAVRGLPVAAAAAALLWWLGVLWPFVLLGALVGLALPRILLKRALMFQGLGVNALLYIRQGMSYTLAMEQEVRRSKLYPAAKGMTDQERWDAIVEATADVASWVANYP